MRKRGGGSLGVWIVSFLLASSAAVAAGADERLATAAATRDANAVQALLRDGVDVNEALGDGSTALLWAAHWDDLEMADLLLGAGADVNASDDYGVTPLDRAAENAALAIVQRLLSSGANPNAKQLSGLTPLMTAARTGDAQVVEALMASGADVNARTIESHSTALMWAVSEDHDDVLQVMLARGADPRTSNVKGFTPLMYAARNGNIEAGRKLVAAGADINQLSADGTHVLPYAISSGQDEFALFLLDQGADPNGSMNGISALHAAAGSINVWLGDWSRRHGQNPATGRARLDASDRLALVAALLARGADPNARITTSAMVQSYVGYPKKGAFEPFACGTGDLRGATPLWVAAFEMNGGALLTLEVTPSRTTGSVEIIQALLAAGADQHLTTDDGTTPFMVAAGLGRASYTPREPRGVRSPSAEDAVDVLLEAGADINAVNEADFTALHGATMRGLNEVVEYLVAQGADINARDFRGRTPYRMAEGGKQSFHFVTWPETAELLKRLGANARLGIPGTNQERLNDVPSAAEQD